MADARSSTSGGAIDLFSLADVDMVMLDETRAVHIGGTYLLPAFDREGATPLLAEARKRGS